MEEVKKRWIRCLMWQQVVAASLWLSFETLVWRGFEARREEKKAEVGVVVVIGGVRMVAFMLCNGMLMMAHCVITTPQERRSASVRHFLRYAVAPADAAVRARVVATCDFVVFVFACTFVGFLACFLLLHSYAHPLRGAALGFLFALHYVVRKRWILVFPIIQRPLFFSLKMGMPSAVKNALKLTLISTLFSEIVVLFLVGNIYGQGQTNIFKDWLIFFCGAHAVSFCWEVTHLVIQVVHTRRCVFAPPYGSSAAETNPTETLLAALEGSVHRSQTQYLAHLDLCLASESNADAWRRAAFFEESGETYKRIIHACIRPLEYMSASLLHGVGLGSGMDCDSVADKKGDIFSQQMQDPKDDFGSVNFDELFLDSQLCIWCARTLAFLTANSYDEDRFGVAQLTGSNGLVLSNLISCLLIVEIYLGKRHNMQPTPQYLARGIKWTLPSRAEPIDTGEKHPLPFKKKAVLHRKAFVMADVLRTSIYQIVGTFYDEMILSGSVAGLSFFERDWIRETRPIFASREMIAQKLRLFLEYRAS